MQTKTEHMRDVLGHELFDSMPPSLQAKAVDMMAKPITVELTTGEVAALRGIVLNRADEFAKVDGLEPEIRVLRIIDGKLLGAYQDTINELLGAIMGVDDELK